MKTRKGTRHKGNYGTGGKKLIGFKGIQVSDSFRKVRKGNQVYEIKKEELKSGC